MELDVRHYVAQEFVHSGSDVVSTRSVGALKEACVLVHVDATERGGQRAVSGEPSFPWHHSFAWQCIDSSFVGERGGLMGTAQS